MKKVSFALALGLTLLLAIPVATASEPTSWSVHCYGKQPNNTCSSHFVLQALTRDSRSLRSLDICISDYPCSRARTHWNANTERYYVEGNIYNYGARRCGLRLKLRVRYAGNKYYGSPILRCT